MPSRTHLRYCDIRRTSSFSLIPKSAKPCVKQFNSLSNSLRPRLRQFEEQGEYCIIRNLIGTIAFRDGRLVEVVPKTRPGGDWIRAVLSLLVESRVDISGERAGGLSAPREDLAIALARLYADQLERALRRDGPLLLMQRTQRRSTTFAGKLDVTSWLRDAWKKPCRSLWKLVNCRPTMISAAPWRPLLKS